MMIRQTLIGAAAASLILLSACAENGTAARSDLSRGEIETILRDYLMENPEIIEEALIALSQKRQADEAAKARAAIGDNRDALFTHPDDYSIGPKDAEITVVEFFDYRCGYCKRSLDWVSGLPEAHDGRVRVVFKEFPILSEASTRAARAALAAGRQGKYFEMHAALMASRSALESEDIDKIAAEIGLEMTQWRADLESEAVTGHIEETKALARSLGVSGTPAFFLGDDYVAGADTGRVDNLIKAALEG